MSENSKEVVKKRKYVTRVFPKNTLKEALRIAQSIHDNNADEPYDRLDLAKSLGYSPGSGRFRTLIASSGRFGLTKGGHVADKISINQLGKSIVSPKSEQEKAESLKQALFKVDLYKKFFSRFDGHKLPKREYLKNTLYRDFGIPVSDCDKCYDTIIKNAKELGVIVSIKDKEYLKMSELVSVIPKKIKEKVEEEEEITGEEEEEIEEEEEEEKRVEKPQVFISHSKNKKIVNQIKQILDSLSM